IITTLVLITYSYAIAGLVIDLMQFIQSFVIALLFNATGTGLGTTLFKNIFGGSTLSNYDFTKLSTGDMDTIAGLTQRAIPMAPMIVWGMAIGAIIGSFTVLTALGGAALAVPLVLLVILICMLVWMFKFYFGCLKCYITAIFKIIIGPLEIAMGAFPNSKMGFNSWIWDIIANLSVFPISMIFLVLGNLLIDKASNGLWQPAILNGLSLQSAITDIGVAGGLIGNVVSIGIGLSVVALMSKLPEMIPQFIFMIKPTPWEQAVGQSMAGIGSAPFNFINNAANVAKSGQVLQNFYRGVTAPKNNINISGEELDQRMSSFGGSSNNSSPRGKSGGVKT
ncbi:hypothetical protein KBC75_05525, partial [Candidatus Shapirobacteria bacterium]|nr:hypothetical protein [Candidatus Shapirobacteria bacterium]